MLRRDLQKGKVANMVVSTRNAMHTKMGRKPIELTLGQVHVSRREALLRSPIQLDVGTVVAKSLLDRVRNGLSEGGETAAAAMIELFSGLHSLRCEAEPQVWQDLVKQCVNHPVVELIHQDPFTSRSFHKPRGYAGDAMLIDYIYTGNSRPTANEDVSPLGQMIFEFTTKFPASAAVRRRDLMASIIDATCAVVDQPRILSVACGHFAKRRCVDRLRRA